LDVLLVLLAPPLELDFAGFEPEVLLLLLFAIVHTRAAPD